MLTAVWNWGILKNTLKLKWNITIFCKTMVSVYLFFVYLGLTVVKNCQVKWL